MKYLWLTALLVASGAAIGQPYGTAEDLDRAIARMEKTEWQTVPQGRLLREGSRGERVTALTQRLGAEGYIDSATDRFDSSITAVVKRFQENRDLAVDGLVGSGTLAALNRDKEASLKTLRVNRDRLKALDLTADEYVIVNVPDYRLYYVDPKGDNLTMRVVVGQEGWDTPSMSDEIETLVVNPFWNLPVEIVAADLAPKVANDPDYLSKNDMEVVRGSFVTDDMVDPSTIDWANVTEDNFEYFVRRKPGGENPLGRIKFLFPNEDDIYLHDTPEGQLFRQSERNASHGCIRVEKPFDLASRIAPDEALKQARANSSSSTDIELEKPVPVHLVYLTAWVDSDGVVQYRDDIYGRDEAEADPESSAGT